MLPGRWVLIRHQGTSFNEVSLCCGPGIPPTWPYCQEICCGQESPRLWVSPGATVWKIGLELYHVKGKSLLDRKGHKH